MKKLLVLIPALNEEENIGRIISEIPKKIKGIDRIDVLVINDGSTDKTLKIAESHGAKTISHPSNMGLGISFARGVDYAINNKYEYMVNIDGDGQFDPGQIPKIVEPVVLGKADFVTASRFLEKDHIPNMSKMKFFGNKMMSQLISNIAQRKFYDVSCGFRAYSREALLSLNLQGNFTYTQESFIDLVFKKMRVLEVPVKVKYFPLRKSRISSNLLFYGINTMKIILRAYRDYKPGVFFFRAGMVFFVFGTIFSSITFVTFLILGSFSPNKWAAFVGAALIFISIIVFTIGILADMNTRIRLNQEKILYYLKKSGLSKN